MSKNKIIPKQFEVNPLHVKILLVAAAFMFMVLSSSIISFNILNRKLLNNVEQAIDDTQEFVSFILTGPETALHFIADSIEGIFNRGEGFDAIKAYMERASAPDFMERFKTITYFSVYGYFEENGEFFDGSGWQPSEEYDPTKRPWYIAAASAEAGTVVATTPYIDANSGVTIISYVTSLHDNAGNRFAVICVDVRMEHIDQLVINKRITPGSFGLMVDQELRVIMHPNQDIIGEIFGESNVEIRNFTPYILDSLNISMKRVMATTGRKSLVFGRQIDNGWYMIILIPEDEYYKELTQMIWFISILGFLLALLLSFILIKVEKEKNKSDLASKQKSFFLANMSHEIRTPMNAILGITEILLQKKSLETDVREALERVYTSGDLLLGIINDILDLSKIEAGKMELAAADYEIASLISDTVQLNIMRIGSKPIEFELSIDENIPEVLTGDELRVKQILNNVLSNAIKYTAAGMVKLDVYAEVSDNSSQALNTVLVFKISDTGQGMTKEQLSKLGIEYSRFNLEANRKTEGTGLGMSITRNLVNLMGGDVFVESEPGKGSVFTIRLPQRRSGEAVLGKEKAENLLRFRTVSRAQMKREQIVYEPMPYGSVLIVDDVEMNIFVAQGLLSSYELQIDSSQSGVETIEKIKKGNVYDIIFMDHMMPEMDGIETVKNLREIGYKKPIVALTANAVTGQADIFLGNGFDDFISKPIDVQQMNDVLNKFIRDKQYSDSAETKK